MDFKIFIINNKLIFKQDKQWLELENPLLSVFNLTINNKNVVEFELQGCALSINSRDDNPDIREEMIKGIYNDLKVNKRWPGITKK